ncbi:NAD(P)/FAD-dependent oxidoreductase [Ameyamaea chiangmaiensis]|uniref:NAD(P)/FAD-dependent oxidoreductase n=1 Tax=Ameyamaea chiangmaiensis TaxID=442969 RepID=A0A850PCA8_9PROT|nr:NAD(P)/FAD-dependent oxidoreductase [Ameyamaea chiangmaiensis]MBS4074082.1 NAD(P)/FAD-dependent oxidoreductase [Ameyamaea chiangmaiensis]NVN40543.1 NAD(P)/FAD-dependent oxidoreductase [Ameyamaea chiangmaiensis]
MPVSDLPSPGAALATLEARVRRDLSLIDYPSRAWTRPVSRGDESVLDVAIIGAGQGGLATAFALSRLKIDNVRVFDRAPQGGEGPWTTFARMLTLRTPKHVTGPDGGVPSLTPRSWYEARYGAEAWAALDKISRQDWQAYLDWFRQVLALPVQNDRTLTGIEPDNGLLKLGFSDTDGRRSSCLARKVVLATGIDGGGQWYVPPSIRAAIPRERYRHTSQAQSLDFATLRGKRVGVLGAGASAFDNAATALEAGAASVALCVRRGDIPRVNPYRWMENTGFLGHFASLPDLQKWRFMTRIYDLNQPPPQETFWRCRRFEQFSVHTGCPWHDTRMVGDDIVVRTPKGDMVFDFLIVGTGFATDLALRPETAALAGRVALWRDRFSPPVGEEHVLLGAHPYLGEGFEFLPREPGNEHESYLRDIHNFTFSAMPSMGLSGASISGMRFGVDRLARTIARDLFVRDGDWHLRSLLDYSSVELFSLDRPPV